MKKKTKAKPAKRSKSGSAPQTEMPDLVAVMLKLTERLEAVERKMDLVINRVSNQQQQPRREHFQQPQHSQNQHRPQHNSFNQQNQPRGYQIVCADCRKHAELPFKPPTDRPAYCKECFSKRKAGNNRQNFGNQQPSFQQRQIKVIPNGVGKVTISEVVSSAAKSISKKKDPKPAKKNRK